jgi:hypothetical protein
VPRVGTLDRNGPRQMPSMPALRDLNNVIRDNSYASALSEEYSRDRESRKRISS